MSKTVLSDIVVALHLAFVWFVVLGYPAILLGWWRDWGWVRNRVTRIAHLAAIALVAVEAVVGIVCPLTLIEDLLQGRDDGATFIGRLLRELLYYDFPLWVFTTAYVLAALGAVWLWRVVPPRRPVRGAQSTKSAGEGTNPD